jgi:hypothetical protein
MPLMTLMTHPLVSLSIAMPLKTEASSSVVMLEIDNAEL